ncbi:hypothetical protein TRVL_09918 [Trypanosoma vivax]|nr:hypothetical protein TRVL_09918 [Trypanosoma vivax]
MVFSRSNVGAPRFSQSVVLSLVLTTALSDKNKSVRMDFAELPGRLVFEWVCLLNAQKAMPFATLTLFLNFLKSTWFQESVRTQKGCLRSLSIGIAVEWVLFGRSEPKAGSSFQFESHCRAIGTSKRFTV